jgi:branched-chain amino acid transport system ATP-binding protein
MTNPEPILRTENVTMRFGGLTAVRDFSIDVPRGSIVGLIGPNGAGKTTVFNIVTGFYKPTEGKVLFDGQDITGLPPHMVCRAGISRTFQNIRLFSNETVLENVMIGCHVRRKAKWWMAPLGLPLFRREEEEIREKSMKLLETVGLAKYADENSASLPYGAQRRVEIARALASD